MGACEEILNYGKTYRGRDFIERNAEVWSKYQTSLSEEEKKRILIAYCENGNLLLFSAFVRTMEVNLTPVDCEDYMHKCFEASIEDLHFLFFQKMICDGIDIMEERVSSLNVIQFLLLMLNLAIHYDMVYVVQYLFQKEKLNKDEVTLNKQRIQKALSNQSDLNMLEFVNDYLGKGASPKDATKLFDKYGTYKPRIYEEPIDYFATKGREICNIYLETYEKPHLLSSETTLKELNDFIDKEYNWDDGVEIPYYIMHHKNCDLALRKKLFRLGAGDCIDEDTYKNTDKDPWKRFILELDDLIKKEEGNS